MREKLLTQHFLQRFLENDLLSPEERAAFRRAGIFAGGFTVEAGEAIAGDAELLEALVEKFSHVRFEPSGFTKNPEIPYAKSITDYIFRWLASKFLSTEHAEAVGVRPTADSLKPMAGPVAMRPGEKSESGAPNRTSLPSIDPDAWLTPMAAIAGFPCDSKATPATTMGR